MDSGSCIEMCRAKTADATIAPAAWMRVWVMDAGVEGEFPVEDAAIVSVLFSGFLQGLWLNLRFGGVRCYE